MDIGRVEFEPDLRQLFHVEHVDGEGLGRFLPGARREIKVAVEDPDPRFGLGVEAGGAVDPGGRDIVGPVDGDIRRDAAGGRARQFEQPRIEGQLRRVLDQHAQPDRPAGRGLEDLVGGRVDVAEADHALRAVDDRDREGRAAGRAVLGHRVDGEADLLLVLVVEGDGLAEIHIEEAVALLDQPEAVVADADLEGAVAVEHLDRQPGMAEGLHVLEHRVGGGDLDDLADGIGIYEVQPELAGLLDPVEERLDAKFGGTA